MRISMRELRRLIREFGVDDSLRYDAMAGFCNPMGVSNQHRDREAAILNPPPSLGDDWEKTDDDDYEEQEHKQAAVRTLDRLGGSGARRSP